MGKAKDIIIKQIDSRTANDLVRRIHYSGKVVQNSQLHLGVFIDGRLEGAMQFGPSLDKRKIQGLVAGTLWHEFIELNRLAFSEALPRNSESRALAVAMRLIKKYAPQIKWVISFADATQCGDGTIYRAAGFVLTGIKKNDQIWEAPDGEIATRLVATDTRRPGRQKLFAGSMTMLGVKGASKQKSEILSRVTATKGDHILETGAASMSIFRDLGWRPLDGFQCRYIYFIDPAYRARLTVPELPYSEIERRGASMYKGVKRGSGEIDNAAGTNPQTGGASPTDPLLIAS